MVPKFYELEVNLNYMLSWNIKYIERLVLSFQFLIYSPKYEIDVKSMWWLTFAVNLFQHLSIFHLIVVLKLKIRLKNMQRIYIFYMVTGTSASGELLNGIKRTKTKGNKFVLRPIKIKSPSFSILGHLWMQYN